MKNPLCLAPLALVALLSLAGCSKSPDAAPAQGMAAGSFKVAMLLPRTIAADGWTKQGYEGLLLIQKELGAGIAYAESVAEADFQKVYEQYAAEGYDLIFGHGGQFVAAAEKAAAAYPRTSFAVDGLYGGNNTNLGGISVRGAEMGYLFGVIAATKTSSKKIAWLGGNQNPSNREIVDAYIRGVMATDPMVKVSVDWVGNFTDNAKAESIARAQIKSGTDVIFVLAGAAGTGVHALAEKAGIFTLAWTEDLHALAPKAVLTSNVQDVPATILRGAVLVKTGRWEGKQYRFGMAEGIQKLAPFNGLLSAEQEKRITAVMNDLLTGTIDETH